MPIKEPIPNGPEAEQKGQKTDNGKNKRYKKREFRRANINDTYSHDEQRFYLSGEHATDVMLEKFADDQLEFFNTHSNALHLQEYRLRKGIKASTYDYWLERSEYLKELHDFCKELLALRRNKHIANYDPKFLTHTLHLYSPRHDAANKYKAKLKKIEEEGRSSNVKVVFEDYKEKAKE